MSSTPIWKMCFRSTRKKKTNHRCLATMTNLLRNWDWVCRVCGLWGILRRVGRFAGWQAWQNLVATGNSEVRKLAWGAGCCSTTPPPLPPVLAPGTRQLLNVCVWWRYGLIAPSRRRAAPCKETWKICYI